LASPDGTDRTQPAGEPALLELESLRAGYSRRPVIFDVSLRVGAGEIVTVLGHNGAGKTTTVKATVGMLRPLGGRVRYRGQELTGTSCAERVRAGMSFTPAERFVFPGLTVAENLQLGALTERDPATSRRQLGFVHELFPVLKERGSQLADTLSGGQQRILSIGIALMSNPTLMLLDEPSLGVSPTTTQQILEALRHMVDDDGRAVVLLEQNVAYALRHADRVYVMRSGRVILEESADAMRERESWWELF
jgi:branched-chain amino acid transport system ATP-binding protein